MRPATRLSAPRSQRSSCSRARSAADSPASSSTSLDSLGVRLSAPLFPPRSNAHGCRCYLHRFEIEARGRWTGSRSATVHRWPRERNDGGGDLSCRVTRSLLRPKRPGIGSELEPLTRWRLNPTRGGPMSRLSTAVVVLLAALVIATLAVTAAPGAGRPLYLNSHAGINARVNDLLHRMTLEEKVGQMDQIVVDKLRDTTAPANGDCNNAGGSNDPLQTTCLKTCLSTTTPARSCRAGTDNPGRQHRLRLGQRVQHDPAVRDRALAAAHPGDLRRRRGARLRPPVAGAALPAVDRHGRDLGSVGCRRPAAAATADALRATGWIWDFAPVQDLSRDNRWGRNYETWAEEPALSAALGAANVRGCRRPVRPIRSRWRRRSSTSPATRSRSTATTATRRCCRSELPAEHDPAVVCRRHRRRSRRPSWSNSGSINGVPATASHYLLTDDPAQADRASRAS